MRLGRLRTRQELTPQTKQVLERWHDPASLDLLKGSPVNCLVLSWADGSAEDAEQQKTAQPLVRAALDRGLAVIGWVEGSAGKEAALAAARSAGLSAVAVRDFDGKSDVTVIPWGDRAGAPWNSKAPVLPITGNVWPGVQGATGGSDATAGPTGLPWLDTNGWFIQLARARFAGQVWTMYDPPGKGVVILPQRYAIAISDSEAAGGRWLVSLDPSLRAGLTDGNAAAREAWAAIANTLSFFERHREWKAYRPLGVVGVVSDFRGDNFELSGEILNLMARRDLPFRVIWKSQAVAQPFDGLKALVYADSEQPPAELHRKMLTFVEQGGLLITGPQRGTEGKSTGNATCPVRFACIGKGPACSCQEGIGRPLRDRLRYAVSSQPCKRHREAFQRQRLGWLPLLWLRGRQAGSIAAIDLCCRTGSISEYDCVDPPDLPARAPLVPRRRRADSAGAGRRRVRRCGVSHAHAPGRLLRAGVRGIASTGEPHGNVT